MRRGGVTAAAVDWGWGNVAQKEARGLHTYLLWRTRIYTHTHNLVDGAAVEREGRTAPRILRSQTEGIAPNFSIIFIGFTLDLSSHGHSNLNRNCKTTAEMGRDRTGQNPPVSVESPLYSLLYSAPPSPRVLRLLDGSGLEHFCLK